MENFVVNLHHKLSSGSRILTKDDPDFASALERWTNIDRKTPELVAQPISEQDVIIAVKEAHEANIAFVPATGGHSPWSTIEHGMIIDMSRYKEVIVDPNQHIVTVRGGILMKELQLALSEHGQFTTVGNGNTVGVIPYMIGGGISSYTPLIGYACENILSARIVVASSDVIVASETQNQDFLWAIRGAGQFFGFVTELIVRTYNQTLIGPDGELQAGAFFFPPERACEVCQVLNSIVSANNHVSAGYLMIMSDPSLGRVLMVAPEFFGTAPQLQATFKPLIDLKPLHQFVRSSTFDKHSDHLDWVCVKGGLKRFSHTGLASINPHNFEKLVQLHGELLETVPGAERSGFAIEWQTPTSGIRARETETSFGLKDVDTWLNVLMWYTDAGSHSKVLEFDQRSQAVMRADTREDAFIAYTNTSRTDPIEHRYRDAAALSKLKELKRRWDPDGRFTKELLS